MVGFGCGRLWPLRQEGDGGDEERRAYEAGGVEDVAALLAEVGDHVGGDRWADDAHSEHDLLHEGVGRAESVKGDGGADGDPLRGGEEAGDDGDGGEDGVEVPDAGGEDERQAEDGADGVAGDHGGLEGPAVDEDSGHDAEDGDGEHVRDLDAGDLLGGGVELEGEDADDGEECEEVSEDGDDLRVPEAAQHGDLEDRRHAERLGRRGGGGCGVEELRGFVFFFGGWGG